MSEADAKISKHVPGASQSRRPSSSGKKAENRSRKLPFCQTRISASSCTVLGLGRLAHAGRPASGSAQAKHPPHMCTFLGSRELQDCESSPSPRELRRCSRGRRSSRYASAVLTSLHFALL